MELTETADKKARHDTLAPFWAMALFVLAATGVATVWIDFGDFWKGYVLDMTGPAWNYILFRGLFTAYAENAWTKFFTPQNTVIIFILVCFGIEITQYFNLYNSTFDPWDFLAYMSVLIPLFIMDVNLNNYAAKNRKQI